jgi:hypothetical protein
MSANDSWNPSIQYPDALQLRNGDKVVGNGMVFSDLNSILRTVSKANPLPVDISNVTINIASTGLAQEVTLALINGKIIAANTGACVVSSSVLPTGAATEATLAAVLAALGGGAGTFTSVADFIVVVAGTAVQGANVAAPNGVILSALFTNTKQVYIGSSGVTNSGGGEEGLVLYPTQQSIKLPVTNLNQIWQNADVSGEGCGVIIL